MNIGLVFPNINVDSVLVIFLTVRVEHCCCIAKAHYAMAFLGDHYYYYYIIHDKRET